MGSSKHRWRIAFSRSPPCSNLKIKDQTPPKEFICPISLSLMADPVIVSSGETFERNCVQVCKNLNFTPLLSNASQPDFSTVIPNIAIKSTILKWCNVNKVTLPSPISLNVAEKLVRSLIAKTVCESSTESNRRPSHYRVSSNESVPSSSEEEMIFAKLRSYESFQQEDGVVYLRQLTRTDPTVRVPLCSPRVLSALKSFLISRNSVLQVHSVAALVNLSLDMVNKVKIVRSGLLPMLVEILSRGCPESVEHSVSLLFSLCLDDQNKIASGVLGALPPLINLLKSETQRVRYESVQALYHLSFVQTNRSKLVKLGAVSILLSVMKSRDLTHWVLRLLCNLTRCAEGRTAMLDANAVKWIVELMKSSEFESVVILEKCVEALYGLSRGSLRFRVLAKEAGGVDVLSEVAERGGEKSKEKAKKMLVMIMQGNEMDREEFEEVDWESLLMDSGVVSRSQYQIGYRFDSLGDKSS